jgi:hypothetical protein
MLSSTISTQPKQLDNRSPQYQLQWRQGQLLVRFSQDVKQVHLAPFEDEQWLVQCLQQSPVQVVRVDPILGESVLQNWANACEQAEIPMFLWGSVARKLKCKQSRLSLYFMRAIDAIAALLLLILLSPVMLAIAVLIYIDSPGAIFSYSWQVGTRGKLFRALQFRTTSVDDDFCTTELGSWMCEYGLDKLPQLLNVLCNEMSLVEPGSLTLAEAVRFSLEDR